MLGDECLFFSRFPFAPVDSEGGGGGGMFFDRLGFFWGVVSFTGDFSFFFFLSLSFFIFYALIGAREG